MKFPEPSLIVDHLHEPALEFAHGENSPHPKDGLFLYGPHSKGKKTREIRVGVIGTPDGIGHFRNWARGIMQTVAVPPPGKGEKKDRLHLANFPGLEETFGIAFDPDEISTLPAPSGQEPAQQTAQGDQAGKRAFMAQPSNQRTVSVQRLSAPASPNVVQAGSVVPAALITGIRSDLPGQITAQVINPLSGPSASMGDL